MRRDETLRKNFGLDFFATDALAGIKRAHAFHERFLECAADGHYFADRLHLRAKVFVGSGELFKLPLWNFYDNVVERWLKTCRSFACDVVGNFVECVSDGELRSDLGNWEAGGF